MSARAALFLVCLAVCCLAQRELARAHPLAPAALLVDEEKPGSEYRLELRRPEGAARALVVDLPQTCKEREARTDLDAGMLISRAKLVCSRPLEGQALRVLGLAELSLSAIIHVRFADGRTARGLVSPEQPSFWVPARSSAWRVLCEYVALGVEHLVTGLDHLLFVLGLMAMTSGARRLLVTLTSFTLGHSITLCLAALSVLRVPQQPVEIGIALSLVALALALLGNETRPCLSAWMAGGFGLLHGLGFAGALTETGLPADAIPLSLFGFNLGVELGQLAVVAGVLGIGRLTSRAVRVQRARLRSLTAYAIGSLAAMWCIERTVDWLG